MGNASPSGTLTLAADALTVANRSILSGSRSDERPVTAPRTGPSSVVHRGAIRGTNRKSTKANGRAASKSCKLRRNSARTESIPPSSWPSRPAKAALTAISCRIVARSPCNWDARSPVDSSCRRAASLRSKGLLHRHSLSSAQITSA